MQKAQVFVKQYATPSLHIRVAREFHDRFVIVDGDKIFMIGASIEHAGDRAFSISPIESADLSRLIRDYAETVWGSATPVFPKP